MEVGERVAEVLWRVPVRTARDGAADPHPVDPLGPMRPSIRAGDNISGNGRRLAARVLTLVHIVDLGDVAVREAILIPSRGYTGLWLPVANRYIMTPALLPLHGQKLLALHGQKSSSLLDTKKPEPPQVPRGEKVKASKEKPEKTKESKRK